ncbi:MAG TPA: hypothetical protein VF669_23025 [Tepidisphaeraceae bacterium]|jgi:hypothetical protein
MAEEARVSGINWRETFPFTNLFRSFRIAVHPSKLALGLVALICLYVSGRVLDQVWPVQHRAVPGEPIIYAQEGGKENGNIFRAARLSQRREIEEEYARSLISLGVTGDEAKARDAARRADLIDAAEGKVLQERTGRVSRADQDFSNAVANAGKTQDAGLRKQQVREAHITRDAAVRTAYADANLALQPAYRARGSGLFKELFDYETAQVVGVVNGVRDANWLGGMRHDTPQGVIKSVINFFTVGPMWLFWHHSVFFLIYGIIFLTVWAIFGGAIARIAAVQVARDEKLSVRAALAFSGSKFLSFVSAPLIPILIILLVGLLPYVAGLLSSIPYVGPVFYLAMSALFVLLLAAGFVMTLVLIGLIAGLNLMYPTIAVEGSDSFDAISRSFSYVYARPWRMLWYTAVAVVYGALTYLFVRLFIYLMLALTHRFVNAGMYAHAPSTNLLWPTMWRGPSGAAQLSYEPNWLALRWDQDLAAFFIAFWVYLLISVLGAFAISFYFTSNTIIYYLMRREVDATEMDDVYLEQSDEDFGESAPVTASVASSAPADAVIAPAQIQVTEVTAATLPSGAAPDAPPAGDVPPAPPAA